MLKQIIFSILLIYIVLVNNVSATNESNITTLNETQFKEWVKINFNPNVIQVDLSLIITTERIWCIDRAEIAWGNGKLKNARYYSDTNLCLAEYEGEPSTPPWDLKTFDQLKSSFDFQLLYARNETSRYRNERNAAFGINIFLFLFALMLILYFKKVKPYMVYSK